MTNVFFETYGCAYNQSDTEVMMGLLKKAGYQLVSSIEDADIIIENTCTVKDATESKFLYHLSELKKYNKPIIIAGCLAQVKSNSFSEFSLLGVNQIENVVYAVEKTLSGKIVKIVEVKNDFNRHKLPVIRKNELIEIVPINKGCLGNCAFCQTKFARGRLFSYPENDIFERIKNVVHQGIKEIWLTSQDTGAYGLDRNTNIVNLLRKIITIEGDFKIRLGMANPNFVYKFKEKLAELFNNEKMYKFLHIPVQSGSNTVLEKMKRSYHVEQFIELVKYFREKVPGITLATDVIAGYPEETEEDHKKTLKLLEELKIEVVNISKFSLRPRIEARKLMQIDKKIIKKRSKELSELYNSYAKKQKDQYIGKELYVFFNEKIGNQHIGKTDNYITVVYDGPRKVYGKRIKMLIKKANTFNLLC